MDRRTFVGALPLLVAACRRGPDAGGSDVGGVARASASPRAYSLPGVQLYTVREEMEADPDRTLAALAEIGYEEVELAGLYGMTPSEMKRKLDAAGLRAASGHYDVVEVRERWEETLEGAQELGQDLVVVPSIAVAERGRRGLEAIADDFARGGEAAAAAGLRFGYHNHEWEFHPLEDGSIPMEILLDRTPADYVDWQMDIYWTVDGGEDPFAWLRRYEGRVRSVHIKDRSAAGEMVDVGEGVVDFPSILAAAKSQGLTHGFVEHDNPTDALESVRKGFRHMTETS